MKRILDPEFRYRPSFDTNVRETFEKARREQQQAKEREARASAALKRLHNGLDTVLRVA